MTSGPPGHDDRHLRGPGRRRLLQREVGGPRGVIGYGPKRSLKAPDLPGVPRQTSISLEELVKQAPERRLVGELLGRG